MTKQSYLQAARWRSFSVSDMTSFEGLQRTSRRALRH